MGKFKEEAKKESFKEVSETCKDIDRAKRLLDNSLNDYESRIKEKTGDLRAAHIEALERAIEAESLVEKLEEEISELKETLASYKDR